MGIKNGTAGNDSLDAAPTADTYYGREGNDIITGGPGNDIFYGGPGADKFVFIYDFGDTDTIADFQPGVDKIDLHRLHSRDFPQDKAFHFENQRLEAPDKPGLVQLEVYGGGYTSLSISLDYKPGWDYTIALGRAVPIGADYIL